MYGPGAYRYGLVFIAASKVGLDDYQGFFPLDSVKCHRKEPVTLQYTV